MSKEISDKEIKMELWKGSIPVMFSLSPNDISTVDEVHPIYEQIPRMSYLVCSVEKLKITFERYVPKFENTEVWMENFGIPLPWRFPVGVLYDLYTENHEHNKVSLPWDIKVHFLSFPSEKIVKFSSEKDIEWNLVNSLKTGMYMKFGDVKRVMTLPIPEQKKLLRSVRNGEMEIFCGVVDGYLERGDAEMKGYPILILFFSSSAGQFQKRLVCVPLEKAKETTFGEFRKENSLMEGLVIVHGVVPDDSTNLEWLLDVSQYPDRFNYFVYKKTV